MTSNYRYSVFLAAVSLLAGCGLYWDQFGPELQLYDGPKRGAHEIATIDQGAGCYTCVQSIRRFDQKDPIYVVSQPGWEPAGSGLNRPNKFMLLPGKYLVTLSYSHAKESTGYVDLQAGHVYLVLNDIFSDFEIRGVERVQPPDKAFVWMEDANTGEILLGEKN